MLLAGFNDRRRLIVRQATFLAIGFHDVSDVEESREIESWKQMMFDLQVQTASQQACQIRFSTEIVRMQNLEGSPIGVLCVIVIVNVDLVVDHD